MKEFTGYMHGMGIGGWLTNFKRLPVLPEGYKMKLSTGDFEHFEKYITHEDVKYIASLGMDHIRLAFDQYVLEEYDKPCAYRDECFGHIERFLKWCDAEGVNVILNLHKAIGCICDFNDSRSLMTEPELRERFVRLWCEIENRFHEHPAVFELMNEVTGSDNENWNTLAAETIAALRKLNPTRIIMVGSSQWNSCSQLKNLRLYDDENVVYTFHNYAPHQFTHQRGLLQGMQHYYNRDMPYPGDIGHYIDYCHSCGGDPNHFARYPEMGRQYLWGVLKPAADFIAANPDKIVTCGEFGTIRHCPIEWRENWMRDMITFCLDHQIPYTCWNYLSTPYDGNRFSLVDDDRRIIVSREMARIIRGEVR